MWHNFSSIKHATKNRAIKNSFEWVGIEQSFYVKTVPVVPPVKIFFFLFFSNLSDCLSDLIHSQI